MGQDRDFTGLLLLIARLRAQGRPLDEATLRNFAALKLPGVERRFTELLESLFANGLALGPAEGFALTPPGAAAVEQAEREHSLTALFYEDYYAAARSSPAHSHFCAAVYGLDLCQHGMADMVQLELALDHLGLNPGARLFEFGCGDGRIAEYISREQGIRVTGLDIAAGAVALARERTTAQRGQLEFVCADILRDPEAIPPGPYDAALAVDSFFFLPDQRAGLERILARLKPGARFGVFYIAPLGIQTEETALGKALVGRNRSLEVIDLTAENLRHWEKKKAVLEELREEFLAEGSEFLYLNRSAECQGWEKMQRWLFLIQ